MSIINNALSGSLAAQIALGVTSQNVANASTAGYTRQGALLVARGATQGATGAGNGVSVPSLIRFSDSYKSQQLWRASSTLGEHDTQQPYLTQLETVFGDDSANLSSGLDAFFAALNAVSVDPTSTPLRQQVVTSASSLAQRVNSLNQLMTNQLSAIHQQRVSTVAQVNAAVSDIAALNKQVSAAVGNNINASALIDARDQKIDALASLVGIQVTDQPNGSRDVSLRSGPPLVVGSIASALTVNGQADGTQSLSLEFAKQSFAINGTGLGGQLGGINSYEAAVLLPQKQAVAEIAQQFSSAVNAQLTTGYGSDGTAGTALFAFDATSSSGMLTVNDVQPAGLGLSSNPAAPGNSDNLLALIALTQQPITLTALGPVLLSDANPQIVGQLGTASAQNQAALATAQTVRDQSLATWKSTSGVNQDEEAINLVEYQQMYQANMKVISVAGTLFDATLAMMN